MKKTKILIGILIFIAIIFGGTLINLYTDWLWFLSLDYQNVFTRMLTAKLELGITSGLIFFALVYTNLWLARKLCPYTPNLIGTIINEYTGLLKQSMGLVILALSIIIAVMIGLQATSHWESFLFFKNPTLFNNIDPIFKKDIGFYVFSFPFLKYVYNWFFGILVFSTILTTAFYFVQSAISISEDGFSIKKAAKTHIIILIALMFVVKGYGYILNMYDLLFKENGLFTGVSFTDAKVLIPCLWIMVVISIVAGIITLFNIKSKNYKPIIYAIALVFVGNILLTGFIPGIFEKFIVTPNQLEKEQPYIADAIKNTRDAYGLNNISINDFKADTNLTAQDLNKNQRTIENIRLWDSDQLLHSYSQTQTIQQYYSFKDVDVDRYWITDKDGQRRYRQVWLSARELEQANLPDNSKTWINTSLKYTHGYGYVMSPVNEISAGGMPKFFVYDIPPKTNINMPINTMGIYVGEMPNNEVFVNTTTKEFNYPKGSGESVSNNYDGKDGVPIRNILRRILFAIKFADINILLNTNIKNESQVLFNRNISERISTLFPFMDFDPDPYLVTSDGKLFWILDGFTKTKYYPYSEKLKDSASINYIRNSFKFVVDAYSGEVSVYYTDKPLNDPIMRSYLKIYKNTFKDINTMPRGLASHIRYSEAMFKAQTQIYEKYHMSDPQVFYNKSDLWGGPIKAQLGSDNSTEIQDPYYTIMRLPNKTSEEFILMTTFTRAAKKNMCSWIAVGCDGDNYGKITLYNFPKDKNVYGPQQIVAKAKQDDVISPQISLWNQQGSSVSTGNLLVIPIENSILYVLPLYLESSETKIPELKRVIVALGDKIVMGETLPDALSKLVGGNVSETPQIKETKQVGKPTVQGNTQLIQKISDTYKAAKSASQNGDWAKYGEQINKLGKLIEEMQK